MASPTLNNREEWLGNTWVIGPLLCSDAQGNLLPSCPVSFRIASDTGVLMDATTVSGTDAYATVAIPPSSEAAIPAGIYTHNSQAFPSTGGAFLQEFGLINIRPTLFTSFAFTDQYPNGPVGPPLSLFLNYTIINAANLPQNTPLVVGARYAVDTSTPIILQLPPLANLTAGTIKIADLTGHAATNPITINPSGADLINGQTGNPITDEDATGAVELVIAIVNGAKSWQVIT